MPQVELTSVLGVVLAVVAVIITYAYFVGLPEEWERAMKTAYIESKGEEALKSTVQRSLTWKAH